MDGHDDVALLVAGFDIPVGLGRRGGDWIPGVERCHIDDVFGNRIELIADVAGRPR